MNRPTRATAGGRAYLDLQNRARAESRGTQELLTLYVVERWLARLSVSPYRNQFVLKGGMLLAAFDARRPTVDADVLARELSNDQGTVIAHVVEIAKQPLPDDGVDFRTDTVTARVIRDDELYAGVRIAMECALATAIVKLRLDVNFGDPISPGPREVELPALRADEPPVRVLGYPIETVLAEKVATAITLGAANTRVRDYVDIYTITGGQTVTHAAARTALVETGKYRGTSIAALSAAIGDLVPLRAKSYTAYRSGLGPDGRHLPAEFETVVREVVAFADGLVRESDGSSSWNHLKRRWEGDVITRTPLRRKVSTHHLGVSAPTIGREPLPELKRYLAPRPRSM